MIINADLHIHSHFSNSANDEMNIIAEKIVSTIDPYALQLAKELIHKNQDVSIEETLQNSLEPVEGYKDELEANLSKRVKIEEELIAARKAVEDVETSLRDSERKRQSVEQGLQRCWFRLWL